MVMPAFTWRIQSLICKLSPCAILPMGVELLAMMCADYQGAVQNMGGVGDAALAAGINGGAARSMGPDGS